MLLKSLLSALGLVLVIEGVLPFLAPHRWREMVMSLAKVDVRLIRRFGLIAMIMGLIMVVIVHHLL